MQSVRARMALSVAKPATSTLKTKPSISVTAYFQDQLKTSNAVLVPLTYELSGDPKKVLGEEAEKKVVDCLKQAAVTSKGFSCSSSTA